jgi:endoglucanase
MFSLKFLNSHCFKVRGFSRIAFAIVACLALVSQSFGVAAIHGQLSCISGHICGANGQPVQMRGMSMYGWTNACGYAFYNASCINHLAQDWHCTAIRMPYQPNGSIPMTQINAVIQACIDNGIYVIVDWHGGSATTASTTAAWFKTVATQWHTYPNIMYEPWNEPTVAWSQIKPYMETVIAAIRAIDPNNIIICGNPQWDQQPQAAAADPITDYKNIAYSMHFYAASHSESGFGPGITTAMSKGCAIFITEYGTCNASGGSPLNLPATTTWYNFLDANKIGSTNWGVECQDMNGAAAFQKSASTTGPWSASDLTTDGAFVKAYIMAAATEVLPNDFKIQQGANAPAMNGLFTGTGTKSAAVFTINGVLCPAGSKLPNGLYVFPVAGKTSAKVVNVIR